jgi:ComF family protein
MWHSAELLSVARGVERLLLPGECLVCQALLGEREWDAPICSLCRTRWKPLPQPLCQRCGQPDELRSCRFCAEWPHELERVQSAVWLDGPARTAVHRLKYDGWRRAAEPMAHAMRALAPLEPGVVLVPIPLGRRRLRSRGYNQAEVLARALAQVTGLEVQGDRLQRVRETTTQTALTPEARLANVTGAFGTEKNRAGGSALKFVLVDDVCTTGATLVAAASALAAAGAARVEAVTFARAPLPVVGAA